MLELDRSRQKKAILENAAKVLEIQKEKTRLEATLTRDAERLRAVPALQESIKTLEKAVIEKSSRMMNMENATNQLGRRVAEAEEEKTKAASRLAALEAATNQVEQKLASTENYNTLLNEDRQRLKQTLAASGARMAAAEKQSAAVRAELETVKKRELELLSRVNAAA